MSINLKDKYAQQKKIYEIRERVNLVQKTEDLVNQIREDAKTNKLIPEYRIGSEIPCSRDTVETVTSVFTRNSFTGFKVSCESHSPFTVFIELD